jgi:hypothetical protein
MATLITYQSSGRPTRRCDANCHNATGDTCHCICGGHFHGAARRGELQQKIEDAQRDLLTDHIPRAEGDTITPGPELAQLRLFPDLPAPHDQQPRAAKRTA